MAGGRGAGHGRARACRSPSLVTGSSCCAGDGRTGCRLKLWAAGREEGGRGVLDRLGLGTGEPEAEEARRQDGIEGRGGAHRASGMHAATQ